jgi:Zn-dependent peptidase ImmA (M78 family)
MPRKRRSFSYPLSSPRRVRREEIELVAQGAARVILSHTEGSLLEVETWILAARTLGAQVKAFRSRSGAPGFYKGGQQPAIYYNLEASTPDRIRCLVHELAHHVLATWPDTAFPRTSCECYDDDRQSVQHRIARRVEEILLGADEVECP